MNTVSDIPPIPKWRILILMIVAMVMIGVAITIAQRNRLRESFIIDWRGTPAEGTAERTGDNEYILRRSTSDGIYHVSYRGWMLFTRKEGATFPVKLMCIPNDPTRFQPRGESYLPTAAVTVLFAAGMGCILYARKMVRPRRNRVIPPPPPRGKKKRAK